MPSREEGAYAPVLRAVRAHLLLVAGIVVLAVAAAGVWATTRAPKYKATAQVLVSPVSNGGAYSGLPAVVQDSSVDPARTLQTATSVVESPAAALATAATLHGKWTQKSVGEAIAVQPRGESDVLSVTGTAGSASQAALLANTYARSALSLHATLLSREASVQITQLQARAKQLPAGENAAATQLAQELTALSSVAAGHDPNFSLLQTAPVPTAATGTSKKLIVVLALLAGLVIGVGAATAIEYLNRRVRDEDEILSLYPLPVLARVPTLPRSTRQLSSVELLPPRVREAFRTLQLQLPPAPLSEGRAILFTSATPGDGKTSSAISFALVLAAAQYRVIVLDFDMPGLRVIGAQPQGDVTPLLEAVGRQLPELLRTARELADYVIVDTPPLGRVSDALRAAMTVDDIVLVSRPGNTDRIELQHTRELLDRMGHTPTGLLVVGEVAAGDAYSTYGEEELRAPQTDRRPRALATRSQRRPRADGDAGPTREAPAGNPANPVSHR